MQYIEFVAVKVKTEKNPKELVLPEGTPEQHFGTWRINTLTAQEGIDCLDALIAANDEYKEDPDKITETVFRKALIEKATTKDGKPTNPIDLKTIPSKLWNLLVAANQ